MTLATEYDDMTDDLTGPDPDWEAEPEAPAGDENVDRTLRRLARIRREANAARIVHDAEILRVTDRRDARLEVFERQERWLLDALEMFHRAILTDGGAKTLHLPSGTLRAATQQPAFTYDDETLIPWARENAPDLIDETIVRKIPKAGLKERLVVPALDEGESAPAVTGDGEIVPGVTVTRRGPRFSVESGELA